MRRLVITLVVLAAILVAADFGARAFAASWVGDHVQESLELPDRPSVSFGGFPFLVEVARGRISSATITDADVEIRNVPFDEVRLVLHDVRFSPSELLSRSTDRITAESADGTARLTGAGLTRAFRNHGVPIEIELAGGEVHVSAANLPVEVAVDAVVEAGALVLEATGVHYSLELPELVPGLRYTSLSIDGSVATLAVEVSHPSFEVSGS